MTVDLSVLALLLPAAFAAGALDAVAGGGGLLTVPALLSVGLDPHTMLGTNKGQSVWGTAVALLTYARAGRVAREIVFPAFGSAFVGSSAGSLLALYLSNDALKPIVFSMLFVGLGIPFVKQAYDRTVSKKVALEGAAPGSATTAELIARPSVPVPRRKLVLLCASCGFYDGFFGPGTGTLLVIGFATLLGREPVQASVDSKVANLASNVAAVICFSILGTIRWELALPMALLNMLGGWVGARLVLIRGPGFVRAAALTVGVAVLLRLAWVALSPR